VEAAAETAWPRHEVIMGIDLTGLRALNFARRVCEFDFTNTVTLGRHEIHFWKQEFEALRGHFDFAYDDTLALGGFCEPLLQKLGAENITSIDASAFEGASFIHDFNRPVPESLYDRFDTFLDFGTIEHIFNVAQVIENIANMVKPGGRILVATNSNGFPAHGLFQYSPEFFYSVFSERNGFRDTSIFLVDASSPKLWHLIRRPAALKRRSEIPFEKQMSILVFSTKIHRVDTFNVMQSDYEDTWTHFEAGKWNRWKVEDIARWKGVLHELVNPYVFKMASQRALSFDVRRKYAAERILINPDQVDPATFVEKLMVSATSDPRQAPIEAH
jgi:SAM-dependent methyltransferase